MKGAYIKISIAVALATGAFAPVFAGVSNDVVAVGPLELVENDSVSVLGRDYKVQNTSGLVAGEKVAVHGALQADGSASNAWAESVGAYVPGSDVIFQTGIVTKVDVDSGHMTVGTLDVDYTSTLVASDASVPSVGELVAVEGTQPTENGVILGSGTYTGISAVSVASSKIASSIGAGKAGITGTGTAGITGTGTAGITGTGTAGITGTGTAGITGTGTAGITGTGTAGITGTGTAGITGTGTAGITGTGTAGITGTGFH
jgi:hypothetical protein